MDVLELRATELRERIRAERVGNNATADVMHTSANQTRQIWMDDKTVDKIGPLPNGNRLRTDLQEVVGRPRRQYSDVPAQLRACW